MRREEGIGVWERGTGKKKLKTESWFFSQNRGWAMFGFALKSEGAFF